MASLSKAKNKVNDFYNTKNFQIQNFIVVFANRVI